LEPAPKEYKGSFVFKPTRGLSASHDVCCEEEGPPKPIKFVSIPFPSGWYQTIVPGVPPLSDDADEEPHWHYILHYAEKYLFSEEFDTPYAAYTAGQTGLRDLAEVAKMIGGLSLIDRRRAKAAIEGHRRGKGCQYCNSARQWRA